MMHGGRIVTELEKRLSVYSLRRVWGELSKAYAEKINNTFDIKTEQGASSDPNEVRYERHKTGLDSIQKILNEMRGFLPLEEARKIEDLLSGFRSRVERNIESKLNVNPRTLRIDAIKQDLERVQSLLPEGGADKMSQALSEMREALSKFNFTAFSWRSDQTNPNLSVCFGNTQGEDEDMISGNRKVILDRVFQYFKGPLERCIVECNIVAYNLAHKDAEKFREFASYYSDMLDKLREILSNPLRDGQFAKDDLQDRIQEVSYIVNDFQGALRFLLANKTISATDVIKTCEHLSEIVLLIKGLLSSELVDPEEKATLQQWLSAQQEAEQSSRLAGHLEGEGSPGRLGVSAIEKASSQPKKQEEGRNPNQREGEDLRSRL